MARANKPIVATKKGQADLFLYDPETGFRGPVELKRRHRDNGMDTLRKEQIENVIAYEQVFSITPRVMCYLEHEGERADSDDHPFMLLTYDQDLAYVSQPVIREVFERTAMATEAGNRAYLEEYRSDRREDSIERALSEEEINAAVQKSECGRDRVRAVLDLDAAQKYAKELSDVVPTMVNVDKSRLPDPTEYELRHGRSRMEQHGNFWFYMNYNKDVLLDAAAKLEAKLREIGETRPVGKISHLDTNETTSPAV